jgi:hypothetical protein
MSHKYLYIMFSSKYYEKSYKRIIHQAGARYQAETNIELPIIEHFDFFTRSPNFYIKIRTIYGNLKRKLDYFKVIKSIPFEKYGNFIFQKKILLKRLRKIFHYNLEKIKWNMISVHIRFIKADLNQYEKIIYDSKKEEGDKKVKEDINNVLRNIREIQSQLQKIFNISEGVNGKLTNNNFLLISGDAGNGKTHLLVDIYKKRVNQDDKKLTIFAFGEQFINTDDVWKQLFKSLKLNYSSPNKFLFDFSNYAYKTKTNGLIIIDALNESISNYWKHHLPDLLRDIEKYPNLSLVISIRNGYQKGIFSEEIKNKFLEIEHHGYPIDSLWEVSEKYFEHYNIKYQDFPLFTPEFQNPLFLYLFCVANRNSRLNKEIRKPIGNWLKSLFETYVIEQGYEKVLKKLNPNEKERYNGRHSVLWDDIVKKGIAPWMVKNNKKYIPESKLTKIVGQYLPKYDSNEVIKLLENGNILNSFKFSTEKEFTFPFDKFSNHIIVRTLLTSIDSSDKSIDFEEGNVLYKYISNHKYDSGILEALCIQVPDFFKKELFELMPSIKDEHHFLEAFRNSLIWRNPNNIKNVDAIIKKNLENKNTFFIDSILNLAHIKDHPLNINLLDFILIKQNMSERDSWWSIYLQENFYGEDDIINRLISWAQNKHSNNTPETIALSSLTLAWFLSSSNRYIRDKSTKGLIQLLKNNLDILKDLLIHFKDVDDDYILERLYCVAYGCCLLNQSDKNNLKELANQTYEFFFKDNKPCPHILIRDYARGVIEVALNNDVELDINENNIMPPYESDLPSKFPSNENILKYQFDYNLNESGKYRYSQNVIINSMQPEHTTLKGNMYGDFGRYTFQSALSNWDIAKENISMQDLSNWAIEIIMSDLNYDVELFGEFDRGLNRPHYNRYESNIERIGKKYQWIAFYRVVSLISDNCDFKPHFSEGEKYLGAWNPHFRDIDPTLLITPIKNQNNPEFQTLNKELNRYNIMESDFEKWIKNSEDIPDIFKLLTFKDDSKKDWCNLDGSYSWDEETLPEEDKYSVPKRSMRIRFSSYLVDKTNSRQLYSTISNRTFWGNWMPEGISSYEYFLGEYPNYLAYKDTIKNYNNWTDECSYGEDKLPVKILPICLNYSPSNLNDCAINNSVSIRIPNEVIIKENSLLHNYTGQYFKKEKLFCFENSIFETGFPNGLIVNKDELIKYLKEKKYSLFWKIYVEKIMIGGHGKEIKYKPKEMSIIIELTEDAKITVISTHEN